MLQRFWPVEEIHVEAIANNHIFDKLLEYVQNHRVMCLVIGADEPWCEKRINANWLDIEKYRDDLSRKYSVLSNYAKIGLHVHLYHKYSLTKMSFKDQLEKIAETKRFVESACGRVVDFAPGWWNYDLDTLKACEVLGLTRFHCRTKLPVWWSPKIAYVHVHRWIHDFDLK